MSKLHVSTTINGEPMEFLCASSDTMLDALRGPLGLTGSKEGCSSGDCGACSITLDDRLVCSCLMLAVEAAAKALIGSKLDDAALNAAAAACSAACRPIDDKRGTIAYRTKVAGVLLKRTTLIAAQRAQNI